MLNLLRNVTLSFPHNVKDVNDYLFLEVCFDQTTFLKSLAHLLLSHQDHADNDWWRCTEHAQTATIVKAVPQVFIQKRTNRKYVRLYKLNFCTQCPPFRNLKPHLWMKVLVYLDRRSLIQLMQVNKAFQTLVEKHLQHFFKLYHPRFVPNLDNLIKSKRYFFNHSATEIRQFLKTKGIHKLMLHDAYYCGSFLK